MLIKYLLIFEKLKKVKNKTQNFTYKINRWRLIINSRFLNNSKKNMFRSKSQKKYKKTKEKKEKQKNKKNIINK